MKSLGILKFGEVQINILSNSEALTLAELTFPINAIAAPHHHINEEINYILEGEFESNLNGELKILKQGDVLCVSPNDEHNLKNIGNVEGKILTVWNPSRVDLIEKL